MARHTRKRKTKRVQTTHRHGKELRKVDRVFEPAHLDANYHTIEYGETPHAEHDLIGEHPSPLGTIRVEYTEGEPVLENERLVSGSWTHGPEFRITFPDGTSVQVLCADTAQGYITSAWT